jgi:hypothetical protein
MTYRKLRIAWSVGCGFACLPLIVLWVHTLHNQIKGAVWASDSRCVSVVIFRHWVQFDGAYYGSNIPSSLRPDRYYYDLHVDQPGPLTSPVHRSLAQHYSPPRSDRATLSLAGPLWFPMIMIALFGILPWSWAITGLRQFSLRTLLIATTMVAVGLGFIVWLR